jgi:hypothetical protein
VTEIDRNHLFYLMARGVDEKSARGLLVKAFVAEVIEELEDEPLVEALERRLDDWFAKSTGSKGELRLCALALILKAMSVRGSAAFRSEAMNAILS